MPEVKGVKARYKCMCLHCSCAKLNLLFCVSFIHSTLQITSICRLVPNYKNRCYAPYIYILYLYITPGCIQYRECTQAEPTRQEHLVRANHPTQAELTLRFRPSRTLPTEWYNFRNRPAVASSYIEVAITPNQQLQLHQTSSCNHIYLTKFPSPSQPPHPGRTDASSSSLPHAPDRMLQFSNQTSSCI
jgi:hypothetical protein